MDNDGFISNGELFQVLKMMVGNNLKDTQLQQIVDKTILFADKDEDGKISFEEFCSVSNFFIDRYYVFFIFFFLFVLLLNIFFDIFCCRWSEIPIFTRKWWSMCNW